MTQPGLPALAARYWDIYLQAKPSYASLIGDHRFDDQLEEISEVARNRFAAELTVLRRDLVASGPGDDPLTRALLLSVIDADLAEEQTEVLVAPVDPYLGVHTEAIRNVAQTAALEPAHAEALLGRFRQYPRLLEQALSRHLRLAESGKTPADASLRRVLRQLEAYLASSIESDPFVTLRLPEGWSGTERWRQAAGELVTSTIRPAFARYRRRLEDEIGPWARPDDRAGLCHLPEGETIYRRLVERFVTVPRDPAAIHRIGVQGATTDLPAEYAVIGQEALGTAELIHVFRRLRTDSTLRYRSAEEMLSHAEELVARAWAAIDGWLGARPDGPCRVLPVPDTLARDMPPAYYLQPAPDGSRPGTYFLNTFEPQTRDRFAGEAIAFHEAIPGHHFDRALAGAMTTMPAFRRFRYQTVHAEGWGLYSERLADEMGLYSGPLDRLGMLAADSWRFGRLVVDTGIHHQGWTREQAIRFLVEWSPLNTPTIEQEVDRYIGWPGQALSYKMGHLEILALRRQAEEGLGSRFDIVGFHDAVLTSGSVTVPLLRELVERWIESRR